MNNFLFNLGPKTQYVEYIKGDINMLVRKSIRNENTKFLTKLFYGKLKKLYRKDLYLNI